MQCIPANDELAMCKACLSRHCFALALDLKEYSPEAVLKERELALYGICFKNKARVESPKSTKSALTGPFGNIV